MLMCFLKDAEEASVACEIVAFCDRLWVNSEGNVDCVRLFLVKNTDATRMLTRVRMLIPYKNLLGIKGISDKYLDATWPMTQFSTNGYRVIEHDPIRHIGSVFVDGFDNVRVCTNNVITTRHLEPNDISLVEIKNEEIPIEPGEVRLIAVSFTVSSLLDQMFGSDSDTYSLNISYLGKNERALRNLVGNRDLEIPISKIFNAATKQGGFDIFLYLPPDLAGQDFNANKTSESSLQSDGTEGEKRQKYLWRGRLQFPDATVQFLRCGNEYFEIHGYIQNPHRVRRIEKKVNSIDVALKKSKKDFWITLIVSVAALIKAFWPDIITIFGNICKHKK